MKKILFLFCVMLLSITCCYAKYFIGRTTTNVNLRECASTECNILCKIPKMGNVFVFEDEKENGFYKVIYIDKDIEGYISAKYVSFIQEVQVNTKGTLQKTGEHSDFWPIISIENACDVRTTLRMNNKTYYLDPNKTQEIVSEPGQVLIIASSPGIIPYVGADVLENNSNYWWKFFIVSSKNSTVKNNDKTVYISSTDGRCYHKTPQCEYINGNGTIQNISVKEAADMNLEPCKYCYDIGW